MDFEEILTKATEAATAAISAKLLTYTEHPFNCGFAWVTIDGTEPLARHCRKLAKSEIAQTDRFRRVYAIRYGSKGYPTGWQFWGPGDYDGQDMDVKRAGAEAFAKTLAAYGIRATIGSRLD